MKITPPTEQDLASGISYSAKCLLGVIICYTLYRAVPQYPFYWAMISVVIVLSPENNNTLALDRIKANILGCAVGLLLYSKHSPNLLLLCLAVVLIIYGGIVLRLTTAIRSALAALVIITVDEQEGEHWYIALTRVLCVVSGCVVALLVTLLFTYIERRLPAKKKQHGGGNA